MRLIFAHRTDRKLLEETQRKLHAGRRRVGTVLGRQQGQAQHFGGGFGHVALGHHAQAQQQGRERAAGFGVQALGAAEVGVLQAAARDQGRGNAAVGGLVGFLNGRGHGRLRHGEPGI